MVVVVVVAVAVAVAVVVVVVALMVVVIGSTTSNVVRVMIMMCVMAKDSGLSSLDSVIFSHELASNGLSESRRLHRSSDHPVRQNFLTTTYTRLDFLGGVA